MTLRDCYCLCDSVVVILVFVVVGVCMDGGGVRYKDQNTKVRELPGEKKEGDQGQYEVDKKKKAKGTWIRNVQCLRGDLVVSEKNGSCKPRKDNRYAQATSKTFRNLKGGGRRPRAGWVGDRESPYGGSRLYLSNHTLDDGRAN